MSRSVLIGALLAAAIVGIGTLQLRATSRPVPGAAALPLEASVGRSITVEARARGAANRYPGAPIPGKSAHWVRLPGGRRVVVHSPVPIDDCEGVLVLTGTVVRVDARFSRTASTALQLDLSSAICR